MQRELLKIQKKLCITSKEQFCHKFEKGELRSIPSHAFEGLGRQGWRGGACVLLHGAAAPNLHVQCMLQGGCTSSNMWCTPWDHKAAHEAFFTPNGLVGRSIGLLVVQASTGPRTCLPGYPWHVGHVPLRRTASSCFRTLQLKFS